MIKIPPGSFVSRKSLNARPLVFHWVFVLRNRFGLISGLIILLANPKFFFSKVITALKFSPALENVSKTIAFRKKVST